MEDRTVTPVEDVTLADFTTDADVSLELDGGELIITAKRSWRLDVTKDFIPDDVRQSEKDHRAAYVAFGNLDWLEGSEWFGGHADLAAEITKATDHMGESLTARAVEVLAGAIKAAQLADAIVRDAQVAA